VVQHQLIKRGEAWGKPASGDERYLAAKLVAVGQSATSTLAQIKGLSAEAELAELRKLVQGWAGVANNSIIERVQYAEDQELKARIARTKRLSAPTSVSTKRKQTVQDKQRYNPLYRASPGVGPAGSPTRSMLFLSLLFPTAPCHTPSYE
jgi:hypothetical protein